MSDNMKWTIITVVVVVGMAAGGFFSWQGCVANTAVHERTAADVAKAEAALKIKRAEHAAALRTLYVKSCRMTPEQAERAIPDDEEQPMPVPAPVAQP